jgi:CIC family chloride channel protein
MFNQEKYKEIIDIKKDKMTYIMKKFQDSGAKNLPVVEGEKYIRYVSKSKILTAYRRGLINITK